MFWVLTRLVASPLRVNGMRRWVARGRRDKRNVEISQLPQTNANDPDTFVAARAAVCMAMTWGWKEELRLQALTPLMPVKKE